jgi:hypothetical protein
MPDHYVDNTNLINTESIVRGLKASTDSEKRKVARHIEATGVRHLAVSELSPERGRGLMPSRDYIKTGTHTDFSLIHSAAGDLQNVQNYSSAKPQNSAHVPHHSRKTGMLGHAHTNMDIGKSAERIWRSHTTDPTRLGDEPSMVFGFEGEVGDRGVPMMPKTLRPTERGDDMPDSFSTGA